MQAPRDCLQHANANTVTLRERVNNGECAGFLQYEHAALFVRASKVAHIPEGLLYNGQVLMRKKHLHIEVHLVLEQELDLSLDGGGGQVCKDPGSFVLYLSASIFLPGSRCFPCR